MAKRRASSEGEVSLFPFLSILACLIGALVLIIVVLVLAQADKADGRTAEEIKRAQDYLRTQKEIEDRKKQDVTLKEKLEELRKLQQDLEEKEQRYLKYRKLLTSSKDLLEQNKQISLQLQKQLDDLLTEIDGLKKQQEESKKEIAALNAEIQKRKIKKEEKPPVVVQPSGSGMPDDTKVYFIECTSGALKILGAWDDKDYRLSATPEVVVADVAYNHFLTEVQKNPNSLVLFLVRDDGQGAYNNGAGRAEGDYKIRTGKLPIPGRGVLDLSSFDKFRGKVSPPPADAAAPPAAAPATPAKPAAAPGVSKAPTPATAPKAKA